MKNFKFSSLLLIPVFAVLAACGGGGGGGSSTPAVPVLKSITVTAANSTMPIGTSQTLTATGTYSDNSTKVLNTASGVVWAFKGTGAVASVFSSGVVTAKAVGSDTFTATQEGVSGSVTLSVIAPWTNVVAGGLQTIARKADGNLYSWGSNIRGQLGDSTSLDRNAPVLVSGGSTIWKQVAVGEQFVVALRTDGTLWSWGFNQNGQLGDGTTVSHATPAKIGKDTDWAFIAAGKGHALAIKTSGALYAWGNNFNGQLGDGTTIGRLVPTKIGGTTLLWQSVAAGDTHSLGIQKDTQNLYGWGGNSSGQVGNAGLVDISAPAKLGSSTWSSVSAGSLHSVAIRADGSLYSWGNNASGQLGNNGSANVSAPVQIGVANNWAMVSAGAAHTMAVTRDGQLWGWGSNAESQLGNGGPDTPTPVQIGAVNTWISVSAGAAHSFGLRSDNSLWGWGRNTEGQLGNGGNAQQPVPVSIPN